MQPNQMPKNVDPQMFVNCSFDIDYLEVTKIEPLRRYEENIYLLGKIFSNPIDETNSLKGSKSTSSKEAAMDIDDKPISNDKEIRDRVTKLLGSSTRSFQKDELVNILDMIQESKPSPDEEILIKQVLNSIEEYESTSELIRQNREVISNKRHQFTNLVSKIKQLKNLEEEVPALKKEISELGYNTELISQVLAESINQQVLKHVPYEEDANVILTSL